MPIILIIFTYNINGLEKDFGIHKLILIQSNRLKLWIFTRLLFYLLLILFTISTIIISVGLFNSGLNNIKSILSLILISSFYIIFFFIVFYFIVTNGKSSSSNALKMISFWLLFCVIIPGSVHQYVSYKYPVNYMTDFLDVNRKQTYDTFKLKNSDLYNKLLAIHPDINNNDTDFDISLERRKIRRSISSIINQMNIEAANKIERQNEDKNSLIRSTYFFNPVSFVQNIWNSCTSTDYDSYKKFRSEIEKSIKSRNKLLVLEIWKEKKVDKKTYREYLKVLN